MLTPAGGVLVLAVIVIAILVLISKKPNIKAAISYLPGIGAIVAAYYVIKEKDEFVKFHEIQGLVLFAVVSILFIISVALINLQKDVLAYAILFLLFVVGGLLLVYMMYSAYKGEKVELIPFSKR